MCDCDVVLCAPCLCSGFYPLGSEAKRELLVHPMGFVSTLKEDANFLPVISGGH